MRDSDFSESASDWKCPRCGSDQIQSYELVLSAQTYTNDSIGMGVMGVRHPSIGVGMTHGVSRTKLAESIPAYPQKLGWVYYLLLAVLWGICTLLIALLPSSFIFQVLVHIVGYETTLLTTIWVAIFFIALLGGGYACGRMIYGVITNYNEEVMKKRDIWKHSYICIRCGNRFVIQ